MIYIQFNDSIKYFIKAKDIHVSLNTEYLTYHTCFVAYMLFVNIHYISQKNLYAIYLLLLSQTTPNQY